MSSYGNLITALTWLAVPLAAYFAIVRPVVRARADRDRIDWESVKDCDELGCSWRNHLK